MFESYMLLESMQLAEELNGATSETFRIFSRFHERALKDSVSFQNEFRYYEKGSARKLGYGESDMISERFTGHRTYLKIEPNLKTLIFCSKCLPAVYQALETHPHA